MISVDADQTEAQFRAIEQATAAFDALAGGSASSPVDAGLATAALVDMLATYSHVALVAVQHVDATVEIAKLARSDLATYEDSVPAGLSSFGESHG